MGSLMSYKDSVYFKFQINEVLVWVIEYLVICYKKTFMFSVDFCDHPKLSQSVRIPADKLILESFGSSVNLIVARLFWLHWAVLVKWFTHGYILKNKHLLSNYKNDTDLLAKIRKYIKCIVYKYIIII